MSIHDTDLITGKSKLDMTIARLRVHCAGKRVLLAFSGGKDSQVCWHLLEEAGIEFVGQYSITRFDPPEVIAFVRERYPACRFRREYTCSLVEDFERKGPPMRWGRWCCDAKHVKTPGFDIDVVGVRAQESARRAASWRSFGFTRDHHAYVAPIIDWSEADVWEYLNIRGLAHCCLYDPPWNMRRIGCVCCPLAPTHMMREAELWPKMAAMLRQGCDRFVARMRARGFVKAFGKPCADWCKAPDPEEEFWQRWIHTGQTNYPVDWHPADPEADAPCLFAGTGFSDSDGRDADDQP